MPSESSWHPAFMPNTTADILPTEPIDGREELLVETHPLVQKPDPFSITAPIPKSFAASAAAANTEVHDNSGRGLEEDDTNHPELTTLRIALTTSLASPGGVELEENPLHNGVSEHDDTRRERAGFPSQGPTPPNKHLSSTSVARTESLEVSSGEDDHADPNWNIQPTDTDPFELMAKSNRTNSFPQVPPAHALLTNLEPLHSRVGDILNEIENVPKDVFGKEDNDADAAFFAQEPSRLHDPIKSTAEPTANTTVTRLVPSDFGQAYGIDIPEEQQSRYEEGLPLLQTLENTNAELSTSQTTVIEGVIGDEDDFTARVSEGREIVKDDGLPGVPALERKSTIQVMRSLHFQPRQQSYDELSPKEDMETSQNSLERSTGGGGIAVSASTVVSQVLADPEAPIEQEIEEPDALETDADLAAKWQAAFAGDEFLEDDDELLGDDEPTALDPTALFGSDDEGFLEESGDQSASARTLSQITSPPVPTAVTRLNGHTLGFDSLTGTVHPNQSSSNNRRYVPSDMTAAAAPIPSNQYAPSAPFLTDIARSVTTSALPPYTAPAMGSYHVPQQQRRPELPKAQSFADKSKGGYASPYDLPMEVVKPRKRMSMQQMTQGYNAASTAMNAPPPMNNSVNSQPPPPSRGSNPSLSPPTSSQSYLPKHLPLADSPNPIQPARTVRKSASGFFEDLPVSSRPKPAPRLSSGLSTSMLSQHSPQISPNPQFPGPFARTPYKPPVPQQEAFQPPFGQDLVAPKRISPFAPIQASHTTIPVRPSSTQYSPVPQTLPSAPMTAVPSRYSPAPLNTRPSVASYAPPSGNSAQPPIFAHQPRTSSPLAHFEKRQEQKFDASLVETAGLDRRSSSSGYDSMLRLNHLPPTREENDESDLPSEGRNYSDAQNRSTSQFAAYPAPGSQPVSDTPPPNQSRTSRMGNSPPKRATSNYLQQQPINSSPPSFTPLQRSQTQSPGALQAGFRLETSTSTPYQRPASVEVPSSLRTTIQPSSTRSTISRPRGSSQGLHYIAPIDGREKDPMQRWRGAPVFVWGVRGTIVTSFPTDVPRYGIDQTAPMMLRSPGIVKIRNIKDMDPLPERLSSFPGPLKGKSKKKEVLSWLTSGIENLEHRGNYLRSLPHLSHEDKRTEERILLWKILRVFIENDGILEGSPSVETAVRAVLSPNIEDDLLGAVPLYATGAELSGISHSSVTGTRADPIDAAAVDQLRKYLLRGEREKAVWEAVDKRLWAHAMLISNTVSRDLYKQVAQEFVQKEVKNIGENTESLAALYEIFAGNFEESIDELVPPSARAGFQMVSTSNVSGPSRDALDGLDRWRETLGLVLSNRSTDDSQALAALGKLLAGYGRAEAAHICFLFARSYSGFGGIDDPQASIVLVGSDHLRQPYEYDKEMEPILLSEVFEYGTSLASTSKTMSSSPHLSVYKLQHATILAEYGYREKALQYCEAIAVSITSQTRRSPYHHVLLVSALDDLSKRLKHLPRDDSSSWISKPSIDKVSGSVWSTFHKFVAGDEIDSSGPTNTTGNTTDVGPFARIAGGTPTISRSPSNSDIRGTFNGATSLTGPAAATKASSRYAPGAASNPPTYEPQLGTSFGSQSQSSFEGRSSSEHRRGPYEPQRQGSDFRPDSQSSTNNLSPPIPSGYTPQQSYTSLGSEVRNAESLPPNNSDISQQSTHLTEQPSDAVYSSSEQVYSFDDQQAVSSYTPFEAFDVSQSSEREPPNRFGDEGPNSSRFAAPSYELAFVNEEPDLPRSTRYEKSITVDDEDNEVAFRPSNRVEKSKAEKDREADEAFRKAAEADGSSSCT